jgi:hypothetical protein
MQAGPPTAGRHRRGRRRAPDATAVAGSIARHCRPDLVRSDCEPGARARGEACAGSGFPTALLQIRCVRSRNLAVAFAGLLVSCGGSGDALAPEAGNLVADLRVTVKPEGPGGPEGVRRVECAVLGEDAIDPRCRVLGGLEPRDLDPVPRRTACPQVYGGPGTARVTGELRGVRVSAEFDLTDACEIARWRRNAALLGAPGVGHGAP